MVNFYQILCSSQKLQKTLVLVFQNKNLSKEKSKKLYANMHTVQFITVFSLVFASVSTVGTASNGGNQEPSDFKKIIEEFRILARVTNAISLHVAAISRKISVEDVLSELFQVDPIPYRKMVLFSIANATAELERMQKTYALAKNPSIFRVALPGVNISNYFKGLPAELNHALSFYVNLPRLMDQLNEARNIPKDNLLIAARTARGLSKTPCFNISYDDINKFVVYFGDDTTNYVERDRDETVATLERFNSQRKLVAECLTQIPKLEEEIKNMGLKKAYEDHKMVMRSRKIVLELAVVSNVGRHLGVLLKDLNEGLNLTSFIWHSQPPKETFQVISQLNDSMFETDFYNYDYSDMEFSITAGFTETKDLLKVFDDLESPWFKSKVARGASTAKLAKALQPYRKISEIMLSLKEAWDNWTEASIDLLTTDVLTAAETLLIIKKFDLDSVKIFRSIDSLGKDFNKCGQPKIDVISNLLNTFDTEQLPAEKVALEFQDVTKSVSKIKSRSKSLKSTRGNGTKLVEQLFATIDKPVTSLNPRSNVPLVMQTIEIKIDSIGPESVDLFYLLKRVSMLAESLQKLDNLTEQVPQQSASVSFQEILEQSTISEMSQCVEKLKIPLNDTINGLRVYQAFDRFPNSTMFDNINQYLAKLSKVQLELKNIQKLVLTIRKSNQKAGKLDSFILTLQNPNHLTENLGRSIHILEDLYEVKNKEEQFGRDPDFSQDVIEEIADKGLEEWRRPYKKLQGLIEGVDELDKVARRIRNSSLVNMTEIFERATQFQGIPGSREKLNDVYESLSEHMGNEEEEAVKFFESARDLDLDFAKHNLRLKTVRVTVTTLKQYFDEIFGHVKPKTVTVEKHIEPAVSWKLILILCIAFVLFLIIAFFGIYGLTENGRAWYKNVYLYWFGSAEDFEKRWRYSSFMDTIDGKNSVLDAVREGNKTSLLKALKNGAYIDAYNKYGNTALHVATKFALPDHVELLIRYGADRSLLNYKNLTPMQYILPDFEKKYPERVENYEKIRKIYGKYEKKGFRSSVPHAFPDSSFHIWMDDATDVKLCNRFMDRFRSITSDEAMPTTTHCVVRVDANGMLETDRLDLLLWVFHGVIIVKEQWMADCLDNPKLIGRDVDYLVENVKFNGQVYKTVLTWSEAMAKSEMPYLLGAYVAVVATDYKNLLTLSSIVTTHGGVMMNTFPLKEHFNKGSHPYLHAHLGPLFLIHDGSMDLSVYKNDVDKMYTLFTEEEFIVFMLKREINRDSRVNPVAVMIGDE
ncbi:hypothetical protein B9Z55_020843 [Caenorhabditis nigoni]|uniref:Uncharacterized protein n=1 Tax=Caenorhabditis nigoni TaxID=1611254 RepID=A0A2G5TPB6_9PELO|nr:hypothetical protein B9Z55_020843 [Caenorhabditis nigoni]